MKVQKIKQGTTAALEVWGTSGLPGTVPSQLSGAKISITGKEHTDTGIFESTVGTYRRSVKQAEVMHFLSGRGQFTPDGEPPISFASGDTLFFEANTEGLWEIAVTMRKLYVTF